MRLQFCLLFLIVEDEDDKGIHTKYPKNEKSKESKKIESRREEERERGRKSKARGEVRK